MKVMNRFKPCALLFTFRLDGRGYHLSINRNFWPTQYPHSIPVHIESLSISWCTPSNMRLLSNHSLGRQLWLYRTWSIVYSWFTLWLLLNSNGIQAPFLISDYHGVQHGRYTVRCKRVFALSLRATLAEKETWNAIPVWNSGSVVSVDFVRRCTADDNTY